MVKLISTVIQILHINILIIDRRNLDFGRCSPIFKLIHSSHRIIKCELNRGLVIINLYVKFDVHFSNAKQIIVQTDRRAEVKHDDNGYPTNFS